MSFNEKEQHLLSLLLLLLLQYSAVHLYLTIINTLRSL